MEQASANGLMDEEDGGDTASALNKNKRTSAVAMLAVVIQPQ